MLSANEAIHPNSRVLKEKSQNQLNVQVSDFLNQHYHQKTLSLRTSKTNLSPESMFKTFQRNLELQRQILVDQDVVHNYQTQMFNKAVRPDTCHIWCNKRSSVKLPTSNELKIPQRMKATSIYQYMSQINNDLMALSRIFHEQRLFKKIMKGFIKNKKESIKQLKKAEKYRKKVIYGAFFNELLRKFKINKFKRSLKL